MDVLIIGSRGREHALALELKKDKRVGCIYCIPGNGGLSGIAECLKIDIFDFRGILDFLNANPSIGLTIVSPDEVLSKGLVDFLTENGHKAFGCSGICAKLETSKEYANGLCAKYGIPSPSYKIFGDYLQAKQYMKSRTFPIVVKTNGRTGGKGVMFCRNQKDAENAMYDMMVAKLFGSAGDKIDIEEFVSGSNVIVMVFTDGKTVVPLPAVENYKRVYDGNLGMSTAGMGASMPAAAYTPEVAQEAYEKIFAPTVRALGAEGNPYRGVLGFNLIITEHGVKVVDFVSRFCDVESQVIIPQFETPILDAIEATIDGTLDKHEIKMRNRSAVCVVATSGGYPLDYNKNLKINIDAIDDSVMLFHAGTKLVDGELRTSGGRVIGVASIGETKQECAANVYRNIDKIAFDGMHYRKDIVGK
jgi:phosphoribosylamine--glycine ligase